MPIIRITISHVVLINEEKQHWHVLLSYIKFTIIPLFSQIVLWFADYVFPNITWMVISISRVLLQKIVKKFTAHGSTMLIISCKSTFLSSTNHCLKPTQVLFVSTVLCLWIPSIGRCWLATVPLQSLLRPVVVGLWLKSKEMRFLSGLQNYKVSGPA
jgi:hypothetical protein